MSQNSHNYFLAAALSLLVHGLFIVGAMLGWVPRWHAPVISATTPVLQMVEPLPRFMDTAEMPEVEKSAEHAFYLGSQYAIEQSAIRTRRPYATNPIRSRYSWYSNC
ncbi:MAG: hypothetical protein R3F23_02705 [Verrucomicrobiia bacterium]